MGFDLLDGIQSHAHYDQQGGPAKVEGDIEPSNEDGRQNADRRNVNGSAQGDPGEDSVDIFGRLLTGSEARDIATKLLHIFSHIIWVERYGCVEITEEDNESHIEKIVEPRTWS